MIKVSIIGASGYSGVYLLYALSLRPDVSFYTITSQTYYGKKLTEVFPQFAKAGSKHNLLSEIKFNAFDAKDISNNSDAVFFCLPHNESSKLIPEILKENEKIKIIDIGADFRFDEIKTYEEFYGKNNFPELNSKFIYGLPDIFSDKIKNSQFIANPGCYPTGALLPILPLVFGKLVDFSIPVVIDSLSGISGAGRGLKLQNLFCETENSARAYNVWSHRHLPEIAEKITNAALNYGDKAIHINTAKEEAIRVASTEKNEDIPNIIFTPHVIPVTRGILTTIYLKLKDGVFENNVSAVYRDFYENSPFVSLLESIEDCNIKNVIYSNNCHIAFEADKKETSGMLKIVSAIDNLGKGASLQAIQNMNLMFGLEEDFGIPQYSPFP